MKRLFQMAVAALVFAGCTRSPNPPTATVEAKTEATKPAARPSAEGDGVADGEASSKTARKSVGPISFVPPPGWEVREPTDSDSLLIFAPERPEWKEIGFRANLGVRRRPHPGMSLDEYRGTLDRTLAQAVDQVNATIAKHTPPPAGTPAIELREKGSYSLDVIDVNDVRALSTEFSGVFELPKGLVTTRTYGLQILVDPDALYSISLTFPDEFKEEMEGVWKPFEQSVRIEK